MLNLRKGARHGTWAHVEDLPAPLVHEAGRGGGPVLRVDLPGLPRGPDHHASGGLAERARRFDLRTYGVAPGTTITPGANGGYTVTDGAATVSFAAPDFNVFSFRSNLVLRWEWLEGSTFFLIWQQNRGEDVLTSQRIRVGDLWDAAGAPGDNFFAIKASYWLKMR